MRGAALFAALAVLTPHAAAALDCAAPPNTFQRNICESPQAIEEWQRMEQTLRNTLAATVGDSARDAVQATQDRWLAMMGGWDVDATRKALENESLKGQIDYFQKEWGWRPKDATEAELLWQVKYRTKLLPALPSAYDDLHSLRAQFTGGPFSVSATNCFYLEAESARNLYSDHFCGGTISVQNESRVCSVSTYWYSGHINTVYSVDDVLNGQLVHRGNCDWNGMAPDCPDVDDGIASHPHWDSQESQDIKDIHQGILAATKAPSSPLLQIDPESWLNLNPTLYPDDWFTTCLTTPDYPPPDQVWPGDGPQPTP